VTNKKESWTNPNNRRKGEGYRVLGKNVRKHEELQEKKCFIKNFGGGGAKFSEAGGVCTGGSWGRGGGSGYCKWINILGVVPEREKNARVERYLANGKRGDGF